MPTPGLSATLAEVESQMVIAGYSQAQIQAFVAWYDAAVARDPSLTPLDGFTIWKTGTTIGGGVQDTGNLLGEVPAAATDALTGTSAVKATDAAWSAATAILWRSSSTRGRAGRWRGAAVRRPLRWWRSWPTCAGAGTRL